MEFRNSMATIVPGVKPLVLKHSTLCPTRNRRLLTWTHYTTAGHNAFCSIFNWAAAASAALSSMLARVDTQIRDHTQSVGFNTLLNTRRGSIRISMALLTCWWVSTRCRDNFARNIAARTM